jgi:hypothetical protein
MLSVLVVAPAEVSIPSPDPRIEILRAQDPEEAVEKLARNRRIDAILILNGARASGVIAAIRAENLAPPPVFVASGSRPVPSGARPVAEDPALAIQELLRDMG